MAAADAEAKGLHDAADAVVSCVPDDASLQLTAAGVFGRLMTLHRPHQLSVTSSAPLPTAAVAAAAVHESSTHSADHPACMRHARYNRSSSCPMQPLPELAPAAGGDVLSLLGPDLMLLKSPAAAEAAVIAQHSARELQRQRSSLRGSSFSAGRATVSRSLTLSATHSLGLGSRSNSSIGRSRSLTETRSTSSKGRFTASADIHPAPEPAADQLARSRGAHVSAQQHHHPSTAAQSSPDALHPDSGQLARPSPMSEEDDLCTAGLLSPFQLHQIELSCKQQQAALKRQQQSLQRRQTSLQEKDSLSLRLGSMRLGSMRQSSSLLSRHGNPVHCGGGSPTGGLRLQHSGSDCDGDQSCIQEDAGEEAAAAAAAGEGGSLHGAGLPVMAKSHCRRLTHDSCCHTAELEAEMTQRIEGQASRQVELLQACVVLLPEHAAQLASGRSGI